jgi:hypothetical protein
VGRCGRRPRSCDGAGLVVAPSLPARLLFGSAMNASGDLVGRISGLVMLFLALGCWPRTLQGEDRQGAFCATYDSCMAGYFFTRRAHWNAAWTGAYISTERAKVAFPPETHAGRMS